ncbi:septum formation initiator [Desulfosporosinus metallidurans]|uniref:Cell division protein FtsL n=1 Tax=Desulfosporosinus metallidurans TaxID=1888891 RepID=A0A1Q8R1G7_9FIRM|nr:septum formation initiator [Desulfosporosinus metallidurans]OLN33438.1 Cell division protein FtsL [Desulfosporosinus metallidurans]
MVVAQEKIDWQESLTQNPVARIPRPTRKGKQFAKGKSILALALIVGMTGAIGVETIQLTVVKGAQVRSLEKDIAEIKAQNDLLQMEADKLRAVSRIESVALSMGMEKPAGIVYVAGAVPAVKNQKGAPSTQVAMQTNEAKPTALHQFSQLFTSFFASTQR